MREILLALLLLLCYTQSTAQTTTDTTFILGDPTPPLPAKITLKGKILDQNTGEPIIGAILNVEKTTSNTTTNNNGEYQLSFAPGEHRIMIQYIGYQRIIVGLKIYEDAQLNLPLTSLDLQLESVVVTAKASDDNLRNTKIGIEELAIKEIRALPSFLGETDVVKSLLSLPGVSSVGEGSGGFNVRGGRVDQNLVLQDGAQLFNTSHVLGFFSVFNPDIADKFTLYKGHIPAQYGGRIASVLDVKMRSGDFQQWKIRGGLGVVSSRLAVEGPLVKDKLSLLIGGRISYSNWILRQVRQPDVRNSAAYFYDFNGSLHWKAGPKNRLSLSYYTSFDRFRFAREFGFTWGTDLLNFKWNYLANEKLSSTFTAIRGNYESSLFDETGVDAIDLTNGMKYYQLREDIFYTPFENHQFNIGAEALFYDSQPEVSLPFNEASGVVPESIEKEDGRSLSLYLNDEIQLGDNFSLSLGIRYAKYQNIGAATVYQYQDQLPLQESTIVDSTVYASGDVIQSFSGWEPRVGLRYQLNPRASIKLSYNRMQQFLHLISNSAAPTPIDIWQVSNTFLDPQRAHNFSIGYFQNFSNNKWQTSLEFYYKDIDNLVEYKNFAQLVRNPYLETELLNGKGRAYGGELYIKRTEGRWTGWFSYAYARTLAKVQGDTESETINNGDWFSANYDKPHNINLVLQNHYRNGGSFALNFTYTSGRPITAIISNYEDSNVPVPNFSERNKFRIPSYWRLDMSLTIPSVVKKLDDSLTFSIYNMLFRRNAYSVFYARPTNSFIPKSFKLSVLGSAFPAMTYNFSF